MIELPYPAKALWPNGRSNRYSKAREIKKHRAWAYAATLADTTRPDAVGQMVVTLYQKPRGPIPDADNIVAALKAYIDGIADAYHANDRDWPVPRVIIGERSTLGGVTIAIEPLC